MQTKIENSKKEIFLSMYLAIAFLLASLPTELKFESDLETLVTS